MKKRLLMLAGSLLGACATGTGPLDLAASDVDAVRDAGSHVGLPPSNPHDAAVPPTSADDAGSNDAAPPAVDAGTDAIAVGPCGESVCTPVVTQDIGSHFTGLGCTGTESYYTPYNAYDGIRRSWDGKGIAGTVLRTETNRSFKSTAGVCTDDWPAGNTLNDFVRIYR